MSSIGTTPVECVEVADHHSTVGAVTPWFVGGWRPPVLVPDEGNHRVIRLWNRVGLYRALAVLLLVGAVTGGVAIAKVDRHSPTPAAAAQTTTLDLSVEEVAALDAERAAAERAARSDAQRKADEAAVTAAEKAKSTAKPTTTPSKSTGTPKPAKPNVPVPASCAVYSGNKATGCAILLSSGYGLDQMGCLDRLWSKESGWNHRARNRSSGAYGIPQALPGSKMASAGSDWATNPATQIRWGLGYIKGRYSTPCGAWAHSVRYGWY